MDFKTERIKICNGCEHKKGLSASIYCVSFRKTGCNKCKLIRKQGDPKARCSLGLWDQLPVQ